MKIISLFLLLFLVSCYKPQTHGMLTSEHPDVWIDVSAEHKNADKEILYCRANIKEGGQADPVCYKSRFEDKELIKEQNLKAAKKK